MEPISMRTIRAVSAVGMLLAGAANAFELIREDDFTSGAWNLTTLPWEVTTTAPASVVWTIDSTSGLALAVTTPGASWSATMTTEVPSAGARALQVGFQGVVSAGLESASAELESSWDGGATWMQIPAAPLLPGPAFGFDLEYPYLALGPQGIERTNPQGPLLIRLTLAGSGTESGTVSLSGFGAAWVAPLTCPDGPAIELHSPTLPEGWTSGNAIDVAPFSGGYLVSGELSTQRTILNGWVVAGDEWTELPEPGFFEAWVELDLRDGPAFRDTPVSLVVQDMDGCEGRIDLRLRAETNEEPGIPTLSMGVDAGVPAAEVEARIDAAGGAIVTRDSVGSSYMAVFDESIDLQTVATDLADDIGVRWVSMGERLQPTSPPPGYPYDPEYDYLWDFLADPNWAMKSAGLGFESARTVRPVKRLRDWDCESADTSAGGFFRGNVVVNDLDTLSPIAGDTVVILDTGTPPAGSSDALAPGDIAEFDGESWRRLRAAAAGGVVAAGTELIVSPGALEPPLQDGVDEGKFALFDGSSNTPTLEQPVGGTIRALRFGGVNGSRVLEYSVGTGWADLPLFNNCMKDAVCESDGDCACTEDAHCPTGLVCITGPGDIVGPDGSTCKSGGYVGRCATCLRPGAGIDWSSAVDEVYETQQTGDEVLVAVVEAGGVFDWKLPDLAGRVWTNTAECCGEDETCNVPQGTELPSCVPGESRRDYSSENADCPWDLNDMVPDCTRCNAISPSPPYDALPTSTLHIPRHGRCITTSPEVQVGTICSSSADCGTKGPGQCEPFNFANQTKYFCITGKVGSECQFDVDCEERPWCHRMPQLGTCTLGLPGLPGVDDDGDGYTDLEDPEVYDLALRLLTNGVDDDMSGYHPLWNPEGDPGGGVDDNSEFLIIALDDDENGFIDDIHGSDVGLASELGMPPVWGTTHDDYVVRVSDHASSVASVLGAAVNNGTHGVGVSPTARLVALATDRTTDTATMQRYLAWARVVVANHSYEFPLTKKTTEWDQSFLQLIDWRSLDASETLPLEVLTVVAAGNTGLDLDLATDPRTGVVSQNITTIGGTPRWMGPYQNLRPKPALVIGASNNLDEFVSYWLGNADFDWWNLSTVPMLGVWGWPGAFEALVAKGGLPKVGSNFGTASVDFAAPGEHVYARNGEHQVSGTSFSAPFVAGAAALLFSRHPADYFGQPRRVMDQLRLTVDTVAVSGTASYVGKTAYHGRLDVGALMSAPGPLTPERPWRNRSGRLRDFGVSKTAGAAFWRQAAYDENTSQWSEVDMLFRVYAGWGMSGVDPLVPTLFAGPADGELNARPHDFPYRPYAYGDVVAADVDGDACRDLVLAGLYKTDPLQVPTPTTPALEAAPSFVFVQVTAAVPGGGYQCTGHFDEPATSWADAFLLAEYVYNDVEVHDFDGDGSVEILGSSAQQPGIPGGEHGPKLFARDGQGDLTDVSDDLTEHPGLDGRALAACDLDQDGFSEIVEVGYPTNPAVAQVPVIYGNQSIPGTLAFYEWSPQQTELPALGRVSSVACGDVDLDGDNDLIFGLVDESRNAIWVNDGAGTFEDGSTSLPDLSAPPAGFADWVGPVGTSTLALCVTEDFPNDLTLFQGNGSALGIRAQDLAMRWDAERAPLRADVSMGLDFDRIALPTEVVLCADLDENGFVDAVFVGMNGRDALYQTNIDGAQGTP
jgi:hypothetical protein